MKDSFYNKLEYVFNEFSRHHMIILLEDFSAKVDKEIIFKLSTHFDWMNYFVYYRLYYKECIIYSLIELFCVCVWVL
jgi:hypothetical protein